MWHSIKKRDRRINDSASSKQWYCDSNTKKHTPLSDRRSTLWYTTTAQIRSLASPTALLTMLHHPLLTASHRRFEDIEKHDFFGRFFLLAVISSTWQTFRAQQSHTNAWDVTALGWWLLGVGWWLLCLPPWVVLSTDSLFMAWKIQILA